jgi:uncharacterized membrane protein YphA (DoxX/SURF4 family)
MRGDAVMQTSISVLQPPARSRDRTGTYGVHSHDHTRFNVPRSARIVKDIFWLAVVGMTLAGVSILCGLLDIFVSADLTPLTLGAGFASVTFSLLGLTDRLSGRS